MGWNIRKTQEQFVKEMKEIHPQITVIGKYLGSHINVKMKCEIHNYEFEQAPTNALQGSCGCKMCSIQSRSLKRRKTNEQFLLELHEKHPELIANSTYVNSGTKVNCTCTICGYTNDYYPVTLTHGSGGCFMCGNKKIGEALSMKENEFVDKLKLENPNIKVVDGYINASEHVNVECMVCGHKWSPVAKVLLHGTGCPQCAQSHGEKIISESLKNNGINYIPQKTFDGLIGLRGGLLSYDFYIPSYNILIEYQGQYHDGTANNQTEEEFLRQQEHDKRKREYADSHSIQLLEIWYWDFDNIDEILNNTLHNLVTTKAV